MTEHEGKTPHLPAAEPVPALPVPVAPAELARTERLVRRRFWPKLKAALARIPFAEDAAASFYAATDPRTPARAKAVLLAALAYFIAPVDAVPDFVAGLGFTDDLAVLLMVVRTMRDHLLPDHYERARTWLAKPPAAD
jgi:uncharacterized membrane protein YkvA (DUF1232 family)